MSSCGDVICGISSLCSFNYFFCGNVIYSTIAVCLTSCTIVGIALITIGTTDGSNLPLIILCALKFVLSCSLFIFNLSLRLFLPEFYSYSISFFFLKSLLGEFVVAFFLFSSDVFISSLDLLTLVAGLCGLSFWCTNRYWKIFANTKADW